MFRACSDPGVMQGGEFLPGVGFRCVGFTAGARAHAVGSVLVALPPVTPHQSVGVTQISNPSRVFFFFKMKQNPTWCAGIAFCLFFFLCPRAAESFGGCREREERGRSVPPTQDPRQGRTEGTNRCSSSSLPLSCCFGENCPRFGQPQPTRGGRAEQPVSASCRSCCCSSS